MEAKLIAANEVAESGEGEEMRCARRLAALDRYLRAVGLRDGKLRHDLARKAYEALESTGPGSAQEEWRCLIAAVDQVLSAEHGINAAGNPQIASRGRIAQRAYQLTDAAVAPGKRLASDADWGTPQRFPKLMPEQDLSVSHPLQWWVGPSEVWRSQVWRLQAWRPAQGLMLGICCLAVVLVP